MVIIYLFVYIWRLHFKISFKACMFHLEPFNWNPEMSRFDKNVEEVCVLTYFNNVLKPNKLINPGSPQVRAVSSGPVQWQRTLCSHQVQEAVPLWRDRGWGNVVIIIISNLQWWYYKPSVTFRFTTNY